MQTGIVLEWSVQAEALTGWTRKEALGADVVDLLVAEPLRDGFRQRMMRLVPELSDHADRHRASKRRCCTGTATRS